MKAAAALQAANLACRSSAGGQHSALTQALIGGSSSPGLRCIHAEPHVVEQVRRCVLVQQPQTAGDTSSRTADGGAPSHTHWLQCWAILLPSSILHDVHHAMGGLQRAVHSTHARSSCYCCTARVTALHSFVWLALPAGPARARGRSSSRRVCASNSSISRRWAQQQRHHKTQQGQPPRVAAGCPRP